MNEIKISKKVMENNLWLQDKQIRTFAAELLTPEYSGRVTNRLNYLYDIYYEVNGITIFEVIEDTLTEFQDRVYSIISRQPIVVPKDFLGEREFYKKSMDTIISEMKARTPEEIDAARDDKTIARVVLYGKFITGIKGDDLSWNEINSVKNEVSAFIDKKKNFNKISENSVLGKAKGQEIAVENYIAEFKSLFKGDDDFEKNIKLLKSITENNNRLLINEVGGYVSKQGNQGILIAWIDTLQYKQIISPSIKTIDLIKLLNKHFVGLKMKENESLRGKYSQIGDKFREIFRKNISAS